MYRISRDCHAAMMEDSRLKLKSRDVQWQRYAWQDVRSVARSFVGLGLVQDRNAQKSVFAGES
jgi:hypothetical protein